MRFDNNEVEEVWAIITRNKKIACTLGGSSTKPKMFIYETRKKAESQLGYANWAHGDGCFIKRIFKSSKED